MSTILTTYNLTKNYKSLRALDGLSIEVGKGDIFGILGPNGSGKTTTLAILLDVLNADQGTFEWFGEAPSHHSRKRIGALLETPNFYHYLSAEQNLKIVADIKEVDHSDISRVLELVNLIGRKDDKFKTYSLGMKQRLAIASALLGTPDVLLLDEPTNGLDPQGIAEIRDIITALPKSGTTVIIASHMLDEIEKVCTHVAILKQGELLVQGRVEEILGSENIIEVGAKDMKQLENALREMPSIVKVKKEPELWVATFADGISTAEINKKLHERGIVVGHLATRRKNLEMQFLEITGMDQNPT